MSKKVFLITVLIVSLVLIGLMMLIADSRSLSFSTSFSTKEQKLPKVDESTRRNLDTLQTKTVTIPEIVTQFNVKADELLAIIQDLKLDFGEGDTFVKRSVVKAGIIFIKDTNQYSEKGIQFLAEIETYEDLLKIVHFEFPKTNTQTKKLRNTIKGKDWLVDNFKDSSRMAAYVKLTAMERAIKSKKEVVFNAVLRD
jgi:hypothetical protein